MIHIHARRPDGTPSYEIEDFQAIADAILAEVGDVIINFSTGAIGVPIDKRIAYLRACRPDVAALNMGSMNYAKYSAKRKEFVFKAVFANPFDEIIELLRGDERAGDQARARVLRRRPRRVAGAAGGHGRPAPAAARLLRHGRHRAASRPARATSPSWPTTSPPARTGASSGSAARSGCSSPPSLTLGGSVRVGLEDNFYLPDGTMARSNGDLIAKARRLTEDVGRRAATVAEARDDPRACRGGWRRERAAARRRPRAGPQPPAARRLLLAAAGRLRRRRPQGRGHRPGRLHPLGDARTTRARRTRAKSALFLALNRGKRSMRLNLKSAEGREVLLRAVREADVVLESFRPGVLDRLGVGYEAHARGQPGDRLLRDHGLRPGRAQPRPLRARHELPGAGRAARA